MNEFDAFMMLSFRLTGLLTLQAPGSFEITMGKDYLHRLKEQFGTDFKALLDLFATVSATPDPLKALLASPQFKDQIESMARQVVNVWLLSMYRIEAPGKVGEDAPAADAGFYEKGAIWPAIKAHPIGFSHSSTGYWSKPPA